MFLCQETNMLTVKVLDSCPCVSCSLVCISKSESEKKRRERGRGGWAHGGRGCTGVRGDRKEEGRRVKKGLGVACAMTSSLICINLSLKADWSRAGETEAARAFYPFQCSLSRPHSVCACVRGSFSAARRRASLLSPVDSQVSSKLPPSELLVFVSTFIAGFSRLTVLPAGFRLEKTGRRREYRLGVAGGKAL